MLADTTYHVLIQFAVESPVAGVQFVIPRDPFFKDVRHTSHITPCLSKSPLIATAARVYGW